MHRIHHLIQHTHTHIRTRFAAVACAWSNGFLPSRPSLRKYRVSLKQKENKKLNSKKRLLLQHTRLVCRSPAFVYTLYTYIFIMYENRRIYTSTGYIAILLHAHIQSLINTHTHILYSHFPCSGSSKFMRARNIPSSSIRPPILCDPHTPPPPQCHCTYNIIIYTRERNYYYCQPSIW